MKIRIIGSFLAAFVLVGMTNAHASQVVMTAADNTVYVVELMQPSPEGMAQRETDWMTSELGLSADQVTKVSAINTKYAEQQMEMFQGGGGQRGGGDRSAMQEQMAEIAAQKRTELEPILSAEQLKSYDEYLANRPAGGRGGFGGPPPNQQ